MSLPWVGPVRSATEGLRGQSALKKPAIRRSCKGLPSRNSAPVTNASDAHNGNVERGVRSMAEHDQDAGVGTGKTGGEDAGGAVAQMKVRPKPKRKPKHERKELPPYNVILLNDDDHSYEYVIEMLGKV